MDRSSPTAAARVAMLVVSNFPRDNRVHKSARTVANLGHDVTVVWAHPSAVKRHVKAHEGFTSIGIPVMYPRRKAALARLKQAKPRLVPVLNHAGPAQPLRKWARVAARSINARLAARFRAAHPSPSEELELHRATMDDIRDALYDEVLALDPDIIHVQDIHPLETAFAVKESVESARGTSVPVFYDAHEYVAGQVTVRTSTSSLWEAVQRRYIREAAGVSTVCQPIAQRLQADYNLSRPPVTVLNVPHLREPKGIPSVRTVCGLASDVPLVIYSGGIAPQRGVATVIEAIAAIPDAHLAVICVPSTTSAYAKTLADLAAELRCGERVHLIEPVDPEDIIEFLRDADVGAHPLVKGPVNHDLALPNKLFDYLHAGLTLTVSDVDTMSAFVESHNLGTVFRSGNAEDCRAALEQAIQGRRERRFMGLDEETLHEFTWSVQAQGIAHLYATLDT